MLAHLIGWDEWAVAAFEISAYRALPRVLVEAARDVDGYNARTQTRYRNLTRDDLLGAAIRDAARSRLRDGPWRRWLGDTTHRPIGVRRVGAKRQEDGTIPPPSVRGILHLLLNHEREHDEEISAAFGVTANLSVSGRDKTPQFSS